MLQDGLYYDGGMPPAFRLLQLNFHQGISAADARDAISTLWSMLSELTEGKVRDLRKELRPGDPDVVLATGELQVLLGYGARMFGTDFHVPALVDERLRPDGRLKRLLNLPGRFPYSRLHWRDPEDPRLDPSNQHSTQSDLALQFTGKDELTVNRPIIEIKKLIADHDLPLSIANFYAGFKRNDRRSWIDFHDGINNMSKADRLIALEVKSNPRRWMIGGTFMTFLQINVDLGAWRALSRDLQELIVGRDKITACPVTDSRIAPGNDQYQPVFQAGCPMSHTLPDPMPLSFRDPSQTPPDHVARQGHIYRANLNRQGPSESANNRIYRQGYEFVEPDGGGEVRQGLNFVGFTRSLKPVIDILRTDNWMGDANFGGSEDDASGRPPSIALMQLLHGAYYAVPPKAAPFPGAEIFETSQNLLVAGMSDMPSVSPAPATPEDDNLQDIFGIGSTIEAVLHAMGIRRFEQIAQWTETDLDRLEQAQKGFKGRAIRDDWIDQARKKLRS